MKRSSITEGQKVITPRGKPGTVVGLVPGSGVRVALDPFAPDWAGKGRGQKLNQKRRRWFGAPPLRRLTGIEVVYRAADLETREQQ